MTDSIANTVRGYIEEMVLYGDALESDDTSLIASGMIDSTGAMELVFYLEETYEIEVPPTDINPDNLDTVNRIVGLVTRIQGGETAQSATA